MVEHTRRRDGLFVTWQRAKGGVLLELQRSKVRTYEALMASLSYFYGLAEANLHFISSINET